MEMLNKIFSLLLFSNILSSVFIVLIFVFRKRISPRYLYICWILLLINLLVPFRFNISSNFIENKAQESISVNNIKNTEEKISKIEDNLNYKKTKNISNKKNKLNLLIYLPKIWLLGVIILFTLYILAIIHFRYSLYKFKSLDDKNILNILENNKRKLNINKEIKVKTGDFINSPFISGYINPIIYIPNKILDYKKLEFILIHELSHYKRFDSIINNFQNIALILSWYNPLVYKAMKLMRNDRETACDNYVISKLGSEKSLDYGMALIEMAKRNKSDYLYNNIFATAFLEKNSQIKRRIIMIRDFKEESFSKKFTKISATIILGALLFNGGATFAEKLISPSIIESAVNSNINYNSTKNYAFNSLERSLKYIDKEKIQVPSYMLENYEFAKINVFNKEFRMEYINDENNSFNFSSYSGDLAGKMKNDLESIYEGRDIKVVISNKKLGNTKGKVLSYYENEGEKKEYFIFNKDNIEYSIPLTTSNKETGKFAKYNKDEVIKVINSMKNINEINLKNYESKVFKDFLGIYSKEDLKEAEEKMGVKISYPEKLNYDFELDDAFVNSNLIYNINNKETYKEGYSFAASYSLDSELDFVNYNFGKTKSLEEDFNEIKALNNKINVKNREVYKSYKKEFSKISVIDYLWIESGVFYKVSISQDIDSDKNQDEILKSFIN